MIDDALQPSDAWRLGRQAGENGPRPAGHHAARTRWVEVESLLQDERHHIVISEFDDEDPDKDPYRRLTEFWLSGEGNGELSVLARAQVIDQHSGSSVPMSDLEGTAKINPLWLSEASAGHPLVVLEYEVTGGSSESPVTWAGKVAVPSLD